MIILQQKFEITQSFILTLGDSEMFAERNASGLSLFLIAFTTPDYFKDRAKLSNVSFHVLRKIQCQVSPYLANRFKIEYIWPLLHVGISCYLFSSRKLRDRRSARFLLSVRNVCSVSVLSSQRKQSVPFTKSKHSDVLPLLCVRLPVTWCLFLFHFNENRSKLKKTGNVRIT
jgi:hypothetical protein